MLLLGDVVSFYAALWLALLLRYGEVPTAERWELHFLPFSILFVLWVVVFFIAGLYEKHTLYLKGKLVGVVLRSQIVNSLVGFVFFYLIQDFGITPRANLFINLITSFVLIFTWRSSIFPLLEKKRKGRALLLATGDEMRELEREVNGNTRYGFAFVTSVDVANENIDVVRQETVDKVSSENIEMVAGDFTNPKIESLLPSLYNLIFSKVKFVDMHQIYEDIFDRIPLSLVKYSWFLENISGTAEKSYDVFKRVMDLILAFVLGLISLIFYPFVYIAVKIEDGGPIFFIQERIGKNNKVIKIFKFRSLGVHNDPGGIAERPEATRVGKFLRKSRIDELPQLWNVVRGDLSMIGPRPEIPNLVTLYEREIPYYNIRHLIKPGLSGWAQLYHQEHPHHAADTGETKNKLSYDLYYIKNRSLAIDLKIALRTIKILLSREGI